MHRVFYKVVALGTDGEPLLNFMTREIAAQHAIAHGYKETEYRIEPVDGRGRTIKIDMASSIDWFGEHREANGEGPFDGLFEYRVAICQKGTAKVPLTQMDLRAGQKG